MSKTEESWKQQWRNDSSHTKISQQDSSDFSIETLGASRQCSNVLKVLKKNSPVNKESYIWQSWPLKMKEKPRHSQIKKKKKKLCDFLICRLVLQEMLKGVPQDQIKDTREWLALCNPIDYNSPSNSPGQNTGVGSLSLLQGIVPIQGSNPGLPHCR